MLLKPFIPSSKFPPKVAKEAQDLEKRAQAEIAQEAPNRRDFREVTTFTIDPVDAKDFDDALSVKDLGNDKYEVGIHIADVTHYVRPGTALDEEAARRATSIYLVDQVIPMLPEELSNDICSLKEGIDRLTYSAVFTIDTKGEISDRWFGRTIIHSDKRFSYDEAQKIIETGQGLYAKEINILNTIAGTLREKKVAAGAILFEADEVKFELDGEGWPIRVYRKDLGDSNHLVEEFMLLANKEVAAYASALNKNKDKTFVYRVHDLPDMEKVKNLVHFLKPLGYDLKVTGDKISQQEINRLLTSIAGKAEEEMISKATIRSMAKAVYSMNNIGHYGLAFHYYTHFTSPIRRYPDMMVHRLLDMYINKKKPSQELLAFYGTQVIHATDMEIQSMELERDSRKMFQVKYLSRLVGKEFSGIISGITNFGIFVEEVETKADGLVSVRSLRDDYYVFDEKNFALIGKRTGRRFRLGDPVRVRLTKVNLERNLIDWELIS